MVFDRETNQDTADLQLQENKQVYPSKVFSLGKLALGVPLFGKGHVGRENRPKQRLFSLAPSPLPSEIHERPRRRKDVPL